MNNIFQIYFILFYFLQVTDFRICSFSQSSVIFVFEFTLLTLCSQEGTRTVFPRPYKLTCTIPFCQTTVYNIRSAPPIYSGLIVFHTAKFNHLILNVIIMLRAFYLACSFILF